MNINNKLMIAILLSTSVSQLFSVGGPSAGPSKVTKVAIKKVTSGVQTNQTVATYSTTTTLPTVTGSALTQTTDSSFSAANGIGFESYLDTEYQTDIAGQGILLLSDNNFYSFTLAGYTNCQAQTYELPTDKMGNPLKVVQIYLQIALTNKEFTGSYDALQFAASDGINQYCVQPYSTASTDSITSAGAMASSASNICVTNSGSVAVWDGIN